MRDRRYSNPKQPGEVPYPAKEPETIPTHEPEPLVWPKKEPEIQPAREPLTNPSIAPWEIPKPPEDLNSCGHITAEI